MTDRTPRRTGAGRSERPAGSGRPAPSTQRDSYGRASHRGAAPARRQPSQPPSRRSRANAGASRAPRASAQRPRDARAYNAPAVWTKDAPRSAAAGGRGPVRRILGAVGSALLALVAFAGTGLAALLRALAHLVARSRIALVALVVVAVALVGGLADFGMNAGKAYPGVRVGQIDAAGKTADELVALIEETYGARLAQGTVTVYANDEAASRIADEAAAAQDAALAEQLAVEEARANKLAWTADASSLEAHVPAEELAAEALAVGREDGGILARLAALVSGRELEPRAAYADAAIESLAADIDAAIGDPRVDYGIAVEDGTAAVTAGHDGSMVNRDALKRTLDGIFLGQEGGSGSFVAQTEYAPLRVDEAAAQATCDAVNAAIAHGARFAYDGATWSASASDIGGWVGTRVEGSSLVAFVDAAKAKPALLAHVAEVSKGDAVRATFEVDGDQVSVRTQGAGTIPLVAEAVSRLDAALFGEDGKALAGAGADEPVEVAIGSGPAPETMPFDEAMELGVIGTIAAYTTEYTTGPGTEARNHNIALVSQFLSNSVVKPGDSWSFNGTAGDCSTEERGFKGAGAIVDGEYDDAIGGGICQVATTMFNAVHNAGFPVLTRHNHSLYIASYPTGRDAAVSWPDLDLVWENDSASDVLVRLSCVDGSVTATLYGVDPGYLVSTTTGDWGEGEKYATRTKVDETLAPNTSYVKTRGTDGRTITVIRTVKDESGAVLHEDAFNSVYDPVTEVVVEGPKSADDDKGDAATEGSSSNVTSN
ncbi:VanW family protein [Eggerthella timonensis]|uniref:VanW family protein n=1 Tax=Eggerthella timonensis TaxID=1871008 RepID=UPI000C77BFD0|nr:VanW family protein [Eggerthella timonensis]